LSSAELKRNRWLFRASIFEYVNQWNENALVWFNINCFVNLYYLILE
jgi:hypothetical protein